MPAPDNHESAANKARGIGPGEWTITGPNVCVARPGGSCLACARCHKNGSVCRPLPACMKPDVVALRRMPAGDSALAECQRFAQAVEHAIKAYDRPGADARALLNINRGILRLTNELRLQRGADPLGEEALEDWTGIWSSMFV